MPDGKIQQEMRLLKFSVIMLLATDIEILGFGIIAASYPQILQLLKKNWD
jgi:hypothetical protein